MFKCKNLTWNGLMVRYMNWWDIKSRYTNLRTLTCSVTIPVFDLALILKLFVRYYYMILDQKAVLCKYTKPWFGLSRNQERKQELLLVKGRFTFFYFSISEVNYKLAFLYSTYYSFLVVKFAFFCSPLFCTVIIFFA